VQRFPIVVLGFVAMAACSSTSTEPSAGGSVGARCASDAECVDSVCDPVSDECVACTKDEHCASAQPACSDNACRTCVTDLHCLARAQQTSASEPDLYVFPTSCTTDYRCIAPTRTCKDAIACAGFLCPSPYLPICSAGTCGCQKS
jgi:hypothetical protein